MSTIDFDAHEIRELAHDLRAAPEKVQRAAPGVVKKAANNIKAEWRGAAEKSRYFAMGHTITYDVDSDAGGIEAEVGPNRRFRYARLAGIAHFGGANGGGGTLGDPQRFLDSEAPRMADALAKIAGDAL